MALTEEQRAAIVERQFNESAIGQEINRSIVQKAEEERAGVTIPELPFTDYQGMTDADSVAADKPGAEREIELTTDDDFLPTLADVNRDYDLREQAFQDQQRGTQRNPGDVSNEFLKPLTKTVRGVDVATGQRVLERGDWDNPEAADSYTQGVEMIRNGGFNTKEGLDENALRGITMVANGILAEGLSKLDFMRAIDMMGVPKVQANLAWSSANNAKLQMDVEDYLASDYDQADIDSAGVGALPDIDKEELPGVEGWADAARKVYEMDNGVPFQGTDEDMIDWYVDEMSNFNWKMTNIDAFGINTSSMGSYLMSAMSNGPEYAQALSTLLDTYDRVNTDMSIVGNSVAAALGDPLSYVGLGGGLVASKVAGQVAKARMKSMLAETIASAGRSGMIAGGAAAGAFEGAAFSGAGDAGRQQIEVEAGNQDEIDLTQTAMATGVGAAVGAGIGAGIPYAAPYLVAGGKKVGRRLVQNARAPRSGRMYRQIGAVGDISKWNGHTGLRNAFDYAGSAKFENNRELKMGLQEIATASMKKNGVNLMEDTVESNKILRDLFAADARAAMVSNQNAIGWYDKTVGAAFEILGEIHPEIRTDDEARFAFTYALAVTSNGLKVDKNFELAEAAYRQWKDTGTMPGDVGVGTAAEAINDSLSAFNDYVKEFGMIGLADIMDQTFTVKQLEKVFGVTISGENQDAIVRGAAILGPKIGNGFYSNLNGRFDALTMDRWFMRSWGRLTASLIEHRPDMVKSKGAELKTLIKKLKEDPESLKAFEALGVKFNLNDMAGTAKSIQQASMLPDNRLVMNKTKVGEDIRKTGNSLHKWILGDKEAPRNGKERERIRGVLAGSLSDLQKEYPDLTMSDLQALLWYPEKRLYDKAKAGDDIAEGYADDDAPDYANAAAKLARNMGVSDEAIKEADANGRAAGTRRAVQETEEAKQAGARARKELLQYRVFARGRPGSAGGPKTRGYKKGSTAAAKGLPGVLKVYETNKNYQSFLASSGLPSVTLHELDPKTQAIQYRDLIAQSKENSPFGAAVHVYDEADYANMRLFVSPDSGSGFAVKEDGDIVSVFSTGGGNVFSMLELAVTQGGGKKLDAFDTILPEIYELAGFKEVDRFKWDDQYMPDDWDKETFARWNNGEPDIVMMEYDPKHVPKPKTEDQQ